MNQEDFFKKITAHAKEYGFIFPSSEIYDGLSAVYDYGQNGVELKKNNDPLIDNRDSKKRYRADVLVEDYMAKIEEKINKEVEKARKRFGDAFNEEQFVTTNPRVLEHKAKIEEISHRLYGAMERNDLDAIKQLILDLEIVCPISGTRNWTDVRQFNLMFATKMGSVADGSDTIYLRPETAQGIFVNYLNVQKTGRMKIPFGIAQTGKAFRNEIVARQFIFRMREFEQMEMQFFVRPGTELEWFQHWKQERLAWHLSLGLPAEKYRFHDHEKLAHYANASTTTRSWPTTPTPQPTSSSTSPSASRSWKASTAAPTSTSRPMPNTRARSSNISIPTPTRATHLMSLRPPLASTVCSSPCSAMPSPRRSWKTARSAWC